MVRIYPHSDSWKQLAALEPSPWRTFLLKELPLLLEESYALAQDMVPAHLAQNPDHLKKMTILLQQKVQEAVVQKMVEAGVM